VSRRPAARAGRAGAGGTLSAPIPTDALGDPPA
jgi:hypothetical protein